MILTNEPCLNAWLMRPSDGWSAVTLWRVFFQFKQKNKQWNWQYKKNIQAVYINNSRLTFECQNWMTSGDD